MLLGATCQVIQCQASSLIYNMKHSERATEPQHMSRTQLPQVQLVRVLFM